MVSKQLLFISVLTLSGTSNRQLVGKAGPQTTQEPHCPRKYGAAWLLACKGGCEVKATEPLVDCGHCTLVSRGHHLSP